MTPKSTHNKARKAILPISDEAKTARMPLPPDVLAGSLEDSPHKELGICRPAKSVRVKAK